MSRRIRVSVVQACTAAYDLSRTLEKLERLTRIAKDRDESQLAVFPEAFIGGYPRYSHFGAVIGSRAPAGRDEFLRYYNAAIEVHDGSPAVQRIRAISKETSVFLIVGVIEKSTSGENEGPVVGATLYCTVIFIDPERGLVGKHRKLMPTAAERVIWGMGDGTTMPVLEHGFRAADEPETVRARMSAAVCWENYMPLLRTFYYEQGTELYCAPTVDSRPVWQHTMAHIALEGRCFVLSACQYAQQKDFPDDHAVPEGERNPEAVMIGGGSVIYGPLGDVLAGPLQAGEGVLTATVDLDDIIRGKFDLDVVGHYARPDIFQLQVKRGN